MRALRLVRLYALAVLAILIVGGMVLRPGARVEAQKSPAPPAERVASL